MSAVEPLTPTSPRPIRRTVFTQAWQNVTFVHWAIDVDTAAPVLPAGVRPDALDGMTQVGLVAFHMERLGIGPIPGLPYIGTFAETNVRLYTVDELGRRGVFFLTLDAARVVPVLTARALGVPYCWSRMRMGGTTAGRHYACRRRWPAPRGVSSRLQITIGDPVDRPTEVEQFVTARWGLHLAHRSGTSYWPNEHEEWPLYRAELTEIEDGLVAAAGIRVSGPPSSVLWSPGVSVRFGPRQTMRLP